MSIRARAKLLILGAVGATVMVATIAALTVTGGGKGGLPIENDDPQIRAFQELRRALIQYRVLNGFDSVPASLAELDGIETHGPDGKPRRFLIHSAELSSNVGFAFTPQYLRLVGRIPDERIIIAFAENHNKVSEQRVLYYSGEIQSLAPSELRHRIDELDGELSKQTKK